MAGWICPQCGEGLPADETCPCAMDWDCDDGASVGVARSRTVWPQDLEEAMRCLGCGAEVAWRDHRITAEYFVCPECGVRRPCRSVRARLRHLVGLRDEWRCHRCGLAVDPTVGPAPNHPLSAVGDHFPISREDGGPAIAANIRIAHSLCNNSCYNYARAVRGADRTVVPPHRLGDDAEARPGPATVKVSPAQQETINAILVLADKRGGLPLIPLRDRGPR